MHPFRHLGDVTVNTRRARLIAVQTLITAILMGVIVVTLLSPDNNSELFGVDVPGINAPIVQGPPSYEPAGGGHAGDNRQHGGALSGSAAEAGSGTVAPPVGGEEPPSSLGGPPDEAGEPTGPTGDQYTDTLARLSESLN